MSIIPCVPCESEEASRKWPVLKQAWHSVPNSQGVTVTYGTLFAAFPGSSQAPVLFYNASEESGTFSLE